MRSMTTAGIDMGTTKLLYSQRTSAPLIPIARCKTGAILDGITCTQRVTPEDEHAY